MEITTQYFETKISAHENHAELTKIQVWKLDVFTIVKLVETHTCS